jgi:hypothetical protein
MRGDDGGQVAESIAERLSRPNYVQAWTRCVFGYLSRVGAGFWFSIGYKLNMIIFQSVMALRELC